MNVDEEVVAAIGELTEPRDFVGVVAAEFDGDIPSSTHY